MKKSVFLLIAILLVAKFNCEDGDDDDEYCSGKVAKSVDDCQKLKLFTEDGVEYKHCCFLEAKHEGKDIKWCVPLTQKDYDEIDDYIDNQKTYSDVSLDCSSNYIIVSILSLILLIL